MLFENRICLPKIFYTLRHHRGTFNVSKQLLLRAARMVIATPALLGWSLFAQSPSLTPAGPSVQENQSITISSNVPVTWSLRGVGSISGQTSTSVTFNAPASITPQSVIGGCSMLPSDSVYSTRIDNLPLNPNSANWVANIIDGGGNLYMDTGGMGFNFVDSSTPTQTLKTFYGDQTYGGVPVPTTEARVQLGAYRTREDTDHHLVLIRHPDCTMWEMYNIHTNQDVMNGWCFYSSDVGCNVQSLITFPWSDYAITSGVNAAGLSILALTPHIDEIKAGVINHGFWFTACVGCIDNQTNLWPATGYGGSNSASLPPYGARFRLRICGQGGVSTNCVNLSSYGQYAQVVVQAMHNYGVFLADIGSQGAIFTPSDLSLDPAVRSQVSSVSIPASDFEVVDDTYLEPPNGDLHACPYNATNCGPSQNQTNSFEQPVNQAVITATPVGGGSAVSVPVAIQPVIIGLKHPEIFVQAGSYSYQIPSWVTGTSNQTVNWTLQSGVGSVTSGGVYTPPAGVPPSLGTPSLATNPGQPLEMGVKFKASAAGYVTGVRFYKLSGMTGTHIGRLWSCGDQSTCATGTQVASAAFTSETASGWQDVQFSGAVAVTANTYYVVSYTAPDGSISYVPNGLVSAATNAPLTFPADGAVGHNGVFGSGAGTFPASANASEYNWCVDLDFETTLGGPEVSMYAGGTTAVLKATSAADSNAKAYEYVTIVPATAAGGLRIDSGYTGGVYTDQNGNAWQPDQGLETGAFGQTGGDYPPWRNDGTNSNWWSSNLPANPEIGIYESEDYTAGGEDLRYDFIVPNGNYRVRMLFGDSSRGASGYLGTLPGNTSTGGEATAYTRQYLEAQGQIIWHDFNYGMNQPGYEMIYRTPSYVYLPAKVTNNELELAVRGVYYDEDSVLFLMGSGSYCPQFCYWSLLNGLDIEPDSTPAHWAIDTEPTQIQNITAGATGWQVQSATGLQTELGTVFESNVAGYITGLRFYKPAGDSGTHTGTLWQVTGEGMYQGTGQSGTQLATGTFTGETASGWQTLTFSSPVAITANTQYVVSYNSKSGLWYSWQNWFTTSPFSFTNAGLLGISGIYTTGTSGTFPPTYDARLFAVDPIFSLSSSGTNPVTLFPASTLTGQQVPLYVQDWYTGVNDPTWSIVSGPGTIQTGADLKGNQVAYYTAPVTQPAAGSAVVIKAQSQSQPSISATVTLSFSGTKWNPK